MITISLNNNKIQLSGGLMILDKIYKDLKVKHPSAFFLRPHMKKGWDGCIDYLTESGASKTGLLPRITRLIEEYGGEYIIKDSRNLRDMVDTPLEINEFVLRKYQLEAVKAITENYVGDCYFPRGVIAAATNAGKTLIAAALYLSFRGAKALILLNNTDLYKQFMDDMPKLFGDNWGYMQGKNLKWADIMVCMTPTLKNNLKEYKEKLAKYNMVLFDECHLITSKTNKSVLTYLYNTSIRVGLSGTPFSHKDKTKNMDVEAFFGEAVYHITNIELMESGYSSPIIVKMVKGNTRVRINNDYVEEYNQGIIDSEEREDALLKRLHFYIKRGVYPILVIGKFIRHVERLYEIIENEFGDEFKVAYVHHEVKNRKKVIDSFKSGETQILVASLIIKLGQNMPLIKYMVNAAGGDSHINALQLIGRSIRTHQTKEKVYYEDFADIGMYLSRHSKHRYKFYVAEKFKVIIVGDDTRKILRVKAIKRKNKSH